jgi:hypothetical protein
MKVKLADLALALLLLICVVLGFMSRSYFGINMIYGKF